ncbi:hypothetical protein SDC9_71146 [bioreactor metagenome]|uniref:Uncharacterized protein n=1 Tax=bioreactor metagenome TaxID=1076179 RepID=A0A644YDR5_9ZZZZ
MTMTATPMIRDSVTSDQRALASGVHVLKRELSATDHELFPKKNVAAYCRVSTDLEQQVSSLETQMTVFDDMIASRADWELVKIYVDDGISGTSTKARVQFNQMIADCEAGKIDYILTKSISRFARNTQDCLSYIKRLKDLGVFIYFDDIHQDTGNASSEMLITILAAFAQEESRSISENIKLGMRMRFKAGKPKWVATYGFMKGENGEYLINQEQAKAIKRIFELYVSGYSLLGIAKQLEMEGVPSMNGRKWWPKSLATILHNEKYIGDVMMQKCYTVDHLTHKQIKNDQTVVPSYYVKNHHEGIIDRLTFDRVQTIFQIKDKHEGCVQYPYFGKLYCPFCGETLVAFHLPVNGYLSAWTCSGRRDEEGKTVSCPPYAIQAKYIDRAVLEAYEKLDRDKLEVLAVKLNRNNNLNDTDIADAVQAAFRWKDKQPSMKSVEYLFLDELVVSITFAKWNECVITWKFGIISRVPVKYEKVSDIPNVELEQRDEVYFLNGQKVPAGSQATCRIEHIKQSCEKVRTGGERPKPVKR